jgi:predicted TIM-barrel fold metal-dependent hydrolase
MSIPKILSVDDHVIEPADLWTKRLPARYGAAIPRVERKKVIVHHTGSTNYALEFGEEGLWGDVWFYEDKPLYAHKRNTIVPLDSVTEDGGRIQLDMAGMDLSPITYEEMHPSCYILKDRIREMARNWVDGSLNFPTMPRFCGQTFYEGADKDLGLACVKAYNDWTVEEWCGESEGHMFPLIIVPLWDAELAAQEIRRNAERGVHAVAFSEIPSHLGLPSIHSGHWDPFFKACEETRTSINMHIGSSSKMPATSADAGPGVGGMLTWMNSLASLADYLFSGVFHRFPNLKIAYSEGGIGWIPYALEKADDFWSQHNNWTKVKEKIPEPPSTYFYSNVYVCSIRDPFGFENIDRIGERNITFETDFPHTDTTWPNTQAYAENELKALSAETQYRVLRGNAIDLLSLDIE